MKSRVKKIFIIEFALFSLLLAVVAGGLGFIGYNLVTSHIAIVETSASRSIGSHRRRQEYR